MEPLLAAEGLELLEVEFIREHENWILRLFIDNDAHTIGIDECALASRVVDPALDVEDLVPHEYSLEVSSPGLNRPLKKIEHFQKVKGQLARIKTFGPFGEPPRKNFLGPIKDVTSDTVLITVDGQEFSLPFKDIAKATLEFEFAGQPKKKK